MKQLQIKQIAGKLLKVILPDGQSFFIKNGKIAPAFQRLK